MLRSHLPIASLILVLAAAAACPAQEDACILGTEFCPCTSGGECDPGLSCASNVCLGGGATGAGGSSAGVGGSGGGAGGAVGAACTTDDACQARLCLAPPSFPGGYCSKICGAQVEEGEVCPAGSACVQLNEASAACMDLCGGGDGSCRPGYVCTEAGGRSVCRPRCQSDLDCPTETGCNTDSGQCEAIMAKRGRAGAQCSGPEQCMSNVCVTEMGSMGSFPGGFCVNACTADAEDKPCPGGDGICVGLTRTGGDKTYVCFPACGTSVACRREYQCSLANEVKTADGYGVCVPRCEHFPSCAEGFTCDTTVGLCIRGTATPEAPQVERQDLGNVVVGDTVGTAKVVSVTVPQGAVSFSLIANPSDSTRRVVPVRVTAPNGQVLYAFNDPLKSDLKTAAYNTGPYALLFPNAPRLTLTPGKYDILIGADKVNTSAKVDVLFKRQAGVAQGGTLPLFIWFTKQKHMTAQSAQTDKRLQDALAWVDQTYMAAGIKIGSVTYQDITGPDAEAHAVINSEEQLAKLFSLADSSQANALHYFMVDHFNLGGGGTVLGISGGIPGPPAFSGLAKRGVAVALGYPERGSIGLAQTFAHEGGHYLGLFHTSERNGLAFDPLVDTPECTLAADTNGNKVVENAECAAHGNDNLMFWTPGAMPRSKITNDQRFVLLRNPAIQ